MTDKDRRSAWKAIASEPSWLTCERDLLVFAGSENDPAIRCGRMDVVTYIRDSIIGQPYTEGE